MRQVAPTTLIVLSVYREINRLLRGLLKIFVARQLVGFAEGKCSDAMVIHANLALIEKASALRSLLQDLQQEVDASFDCLAMLPVLMRVTRTQEGK